jgi:hypothetical protein
MAGIVEKNGSGDEAEHHVKFNLQEEEVKNHHEFLEINKLNEYNFNIHLGYLKVDHYYKVTFSIELGKNHRIDVENFDNSYLRDKSSKNVTFKGAKFDSATGVCQFTIVFYAFREKTDIERVYFRLSDTNDEHLLTLNFEAKVLGAHQGTPLLRNGITLLTHHSEKSHFNIN